MNDLTGFKRDQLRGIATLGETSGLDLLDWLEETADYSDVGAPRLYMNLDDLTDMGLIRKNAADGRTNAYSLTPRGKREVVYHANEWTKAVASLAVGGRPRSVEVDGGEAKSGLAALFQEAD